MYPPPRVTHRVVETRRGTSLRRARFAGYVLPVTFCRLCIIGMYCRLCIVGMYCRADTYALYICGNITHRVQPTAYPPNRVQPTACNPPRENPRVKTHRVVETCRGASLRRHVLSCMFCRLCIVGIFCRARPKTQNPHPLLYILSILRTYYIFRKSSQYIANFFASLQKLSTMNRIDRPLYTQRIMSNLSNAGRKIFVNFLMPLGSFSYLCQLYRHVLSCTFCRLCIVGMYYRVRPIPIFPEKSTL